MFADIMEALMSGLGGGATAIGGMMNNQNKMKLQAEEQERKDAASIQKAIAIAQGVSKIPNRPSAPGPAPRPRPRPATPGNVIPGNTNRVPKWNPVTKRFE